MRNWKRKFEDSREREGERGGERDEVGEIEI